MKVVGAGPDPVGDRAATRVSEFGPIGAGHDAILLHGFDARDARSLIVVSGGVGGAVDRDIRGGAFGPIDAPGIGAALAGVVLAGEAVVALGAGRAEINELQRIADVQRN